MSTSILQQLGVFTLAVLFSVLFTSMNNRESKNKKERLNSMKE